MTPGRRGSGFIAAGVSLLIVGFIAAVIGVALGGVHVTTPASIGGGTVDCGTPFSPDSSGESLDNLGRGFAGEGAGDVCGSPMHDRRLLVFLLLGVGGGIAVLSVAGLVIPGAIVRREAGRS